LPAVRVRFAPSPTGELHIGGARTALFNYLFARATRGTLVLRIDDTDQERSRPEYTEALLEAMLWLGLKWDEGPHFQSRRSAEYNRLAARLLDQNKAYHCFCSSEEL
jgi:glutamyl-tRNA synthetase